METSESKDHQCRTRDRTRLPWALIQGSLVHNLSQDEYKLCVFGVYVRVGEHGNYSTIVSWGRRMYRLYLNCE